MDGSVCMVMPTYNERANLEPTLSDIFAHNPGVDVLIVDDSSPDGTGELADAISLATCSTQDSHVFVMHRPQKLGLGSAYIDGFTWALAHHYDVIGEMDMDGSHRAQDLVHILSTLRNHPDIDLVIGSRRVQGGAIEHWPWYRNALSQIGSTYARLMLAIPVHDMTSGFRAYRAPILEKLDLSHIDDNGYVFQIDMVRRVIASGGTIMEVPITFPERTQGESKMSASIVREAAAKVSQWGWARLVHHGRDHIE